MAPLYARLVVLLGLLLLPVVVYSILTAYQAYQQGRTQSLEGVRQLGELAAGQEEALTNAAKRLLVALTRANVVPALLMQTTDCSARTASIIEAFKAEYRYLGITDAKGNILCS